MYAMPRVVSRNPSNYCRVSRSFSLLLLPLVRSFVPLDPPFQEIRRVHMMMASNILMLSDMPADILNCIQERLPLADYLRFPAVCRSFRSAAKQISHRPFSDTHFPWLLSFGSFYSNDFTATAFIPSSPHPKTYSIPFPPLFKDFNILSSDRHFLFIEYQYSSFGPPSSKGIYILNPFDSWAQLGRLPSALCTKDIGGIFNLAINGANTVVLGIYGRGLAYTRMSGDRWISLNDALPPPTDMFQDVVAHKDDLFYAVQMNATNVLALDFSSSSSTAPVRVTDMTLNLQPCSETPGWSCFQKASLVSSPCGLFLVRWRCLLKTTGEEDTIKRREIDIYRLMDDECAPNKSWVQIDSLPNLSFFISIYCSFALSPLDFPRLRSNRIHLPFDAIWNVKHDYDNSDSIKDNYGDNSRHLVYDLGDGSWEQFCGNEYVDGVWVTPRLRPNSPLLG